MWRRTVGTGRRLASSSKIRKSCFAVCHCTGGADFDKIVMSKVDAVSKRRMVAMKHKIGSPHGHIAFTAKYVRAALVAAAFASAAFAARPYDAQVEYLEAEIHGKGACVN